MVGSLPIQSGTITQGHAVPLVAAPHNGGFTDVFAAMLSGVLQKRHGPDSPVAQASVASPRETAGTGQAQTEAVAIVEELPGTPSPVVAAPVTALARTAVGEADAAPLPPRKGAKGAGAETEAVARSPGDQTVPVITMTVQDLLLPRAAQVSGQAQVIPPSTAPGFSPAAAPPASESGARKAAETHRDAPSAARNEPPDRPEHAAAAASLPPSTATDAKPEQSAGRSEAVAAAALTARSGVPQSAPIGLESVTLPASGQNQLQGQNQVLGQERAAPADQIAPALVGMLKTADGVQSVTVSLQPAELGLVRIRIDQTAEGAAHVNVTAERPETLELLQRDQPRLLQALDQAGVPSDGRSVSFQVAAPEQVGASASRPDSMATGSDDSGQRQSGDARRENGDARQDPGAGADQRQGQARARWFRAGLDITA
jgi:hypothetical protein